MCKLIVLLKIHFDLPRTFKKETYVISNEIKLFLTPTPLSRNPKYV